MKHDCDKRNRSITVQVPRNPYFEGIGPAAQNLLTAGT